MSEQLLTKILEEVQSLSVQVHSVDRRVQSIENRMESIENRLESVENRLESVENRLESVENRVGAVEKRQDETYQIVRAIYSRQELTDAKLDALTIDVRKMQGDFVELKESQERQDRILESLAIHSFDQEAQLRDLKKIKSPA